MRMSLTMSSRRAEVSACWAAPVSRRVMRSRHSGGGCEASLASKLATIAASDSSILEPSLSWAELLPMTCTTTHPVNGTRMAVRTGSRYRLTRVRTTTRRESLFSVSAAVGRVMVVVR